MLSLPPKHLRVRSFVCRNGRTTEGQRRAYDHIWPKFGLNNEHGSINLAEWFDREAPTFLEIGFGMGHSLLAAAKAFPEKNFIGVETHKPGIGALCLGIEMNELTNLRMCYGDVIDVLEKNIPNKSLDGVQIFFPDPWQKRRHHIRRLVQPNFLKTLIQKLKPNGTLHLATDWDDYAVHMMRVLSQEPAITNLFGDKQFATRSCYRPIISKFEQRAIREGRQIWELQFALSNS